MIKPILAILAAALALSAQAQQVCNRIGNQVFCSGPSGSSTATRIGDTTLVNRSNGSSATVTQIGRQSFITDSNPRRSGVATRIGDTTFVNRADGSSATINRIGSQTLITESRKPSRWVLDDEEDE